MWIVESESGWMEEGRQGQTGRRRRTSRRRRRRERERGKVNYMCIVDRSKQIASPDGPRKYCILNRSDRIVLFVSAAAICAICLDVVVFGLPFLIPTRSRRLRALVVGCA